MSMKVTEDDVINKAAEDIYAWFLDGRTLWSREMTKVHARNLAQRLADAGLLPTETEWGVQNRDVPAEKEHVFRTRDAAEVAQMIVRANFPWPEEIVLVTRNVTPWKDAS